MSSKRDQTAQVVETGGGEGGGEGDDGGGRNNGNNTATSITSQSSATNTNTSTTTYVFPSAPSECLEPPKQSPPPPHQMEGTSQTPTQSTITTPDIQHQHGLQQPSKVIKGKPPLLKTASLGPGISAFGSEEEKQKVQQQQQQGKTGLLHQSARHPPLPTCSLSNINKVGSQQTQQQSVSDSTSRVTLHQHGVHHHHQRLGSSSGSGNNNNPQTAPGGVGVSTIQGVGVGAPPISLSGAMGNSGSSGLKMPQRSALKGHCRSASHGGVIAPSRTIDVSSLAGEGAGTGTGGPGGVVVGKPSAMKKGHTRAASHGQIVEDPAQLGHRRAPSKTDFILPPDHVEKEKERERSGSNAMIKGVGTGGPDVIPGIADRGQPFPGRGHSRQASRTESIYTLRHHPTSTRNKLFFWRKSKTENSRIRTIYPNHTVPPNTRKDEHPNAKYCNNRICTTKYTLISFLPKNLFEQFHRFANLYFISIVLLNWIPEISAFGKEIAMLPVMFVLGVTAIKDMFEDRRRYNSDKRINNATCRVWDR